MDRKSVFAYTPLGFAPPYLSVNREADGVITIMVRSEDAGKGSPGHGSISVPYGELEKLAFALLEYCVDQADI